MPTRRDRTLRIIKGDRSAAASRPTRRRVVLRPVPTPIEEMLEQLDREPVEDRAGSGGAAVSAVRADMPAGADEGRADRADMPAEPADGGRVGGDGIGDDGPPWDAARPARRRVLVGLLVALLAGALALAGLYGHRWYDHQTLTESRQGALAAGRQASVNFVSVSAASVDRDLQRIADGATGDFADEFTRGRSQVRAAVVENKVESRGSVLRAGLVSGDRRRAVVLVAVDATVKNAKVPDGRASHYRIQLDLVHDRESGEWLVSRLQFVG